MRMLSPRNLGALCVLILACSLAHAGLLDDRLLPASEFQGWVNLKYESKDTTLCQIYRKTLTDLPKGVTNGYLVFSYQAEQVDSAADAAVKAQALLQKQRFSSEIAKGYAVTPEPWAAHGQQGVVFTVRGLTHTTDVVQAQRAEIYTCAFTRDNWLIWLELRQAFSAKELDMADRVQQRNSVKAQADQLLGSLLMIWHFTPQPLPAQPAEQPKQPEQPKRPEQPAALPEPPKQPEQPMQPVQPTQPVQTPVTAEQPKQPEQPSQPVQPVVPVQTPVQPEHPAQPAVIPPVKPSEHPDQPRPVVVVPPAQPEQPAQPVTPAQPDQPTQPVVPAQPEQPAQPVTPPQPEQPTQPVTPVQPEQPAQPEQPKQPEQPAQPVTPEQPKPPEQPAPVVPGMRWQTEDKHLSLELPAGVTASEKYPYTLTGLPEMTLRLYPPEEYIDAKDLAIALSDFAESQQFVSLNDFTQAPCTIDGAAGMQVHYTSRAKRTVQAYYFGKSGRLWRLEATLNGENTPVPAALDTLMKSIRVE